MGREVLGAPKLMADIPDAWSRDDKRGFHISENGTRLLEGEVSGLSKLDDDALQAMLAQLEGNIWMGWKHIPSCDLKGADYSCATALPAKAEIREAWLGQGENKAISAEEITTLLGLDKVSEFASSLGLSQESAQNALAEVIPQVVDKSTSGEGGILDEMLGQVGGPQGAMEMLGKMFR